MFHSGSPGIDDFNRAAALCFDGSAECPSRQLAVVVEDRVATAPVIQASAFGRDQIIIAGNFTEPEARAIASSLMAAGSFRPVLTSLPMGDQP